MYYHTHIEKVLTNIILLKSTVIVPLLTAMALYYHGFPGPLLDECWFFVVVFAICEFIYTAAVLFSS